MIIRRLLTAACCLAAAAGMTAQTKLTATQLKAMFASKTYNQVSVHDPSVVYNPSDKNFYIVGTQMGIAKSSNLIGFNAVNNSQLYVKDYSEAFTACPTHEVQVTRDGITTTETLPSFNAGAHCATYAGIQVGDRLPTTEAEWIRGDQWAPDMVYNPNMNK